MPICLCCFINASPVGFSHTQHFVQLCSVCAKHTNDESKRQRDHLTMTNRLRERHAGMLARLSDQVAAAKLENKRLQEDIEQLARTIASEYAERPVGYVQSIIEKAVVAQAESQARGAMRSRDRAMAAVFRIEKLHHDAGKGLCKCGVRLDKCRETAALDFIRQSYYDWENRQIERDKKGLAHGLPLDHPRGQMFRGHEWDWKGLPSTEVDPPRRLLA